MEITWRNFVTGMPERNQPKWAKILTFRQTRHGAARLAGVLAVTLSIAAALAVSAVAQTPSARRQPPSTPAAAPQNKPAPATAADTPAAPQSAAAAPDPSMVVEGFRSAHFGMSEAQVRAAIAADFHAEPNAIHEDRNPAELTQVLTISVPDLLEGGGRATVAYIFGYKSKTLIQVSATWSKATDDTMTDAKLYSNANILREHLINAGYRPDTVISNVPVASGLLMFRGGDAQGHSTVLVLQGSFRTGENNRRVITPTGLLLYYIADPKSPDIFKLPAGSF